MDIFTRLQNMIESPNDISMVDVFDSPENKKKKQGLSHEVSRVDHSYDTQ